MAGRSLRMLEMALEKTQAQSEYVARNVNGEKKFRRKHKQESPQHQHESGFTSQLPRPSQAPAHVCMMGQMPVSPEPLRNSEQQSLEGGKAMIPKPLPEERQMNEVVRDGVAVPPKAESDQRNRGPAQQNHSVKHRERYQHRIPTR